MMNISEMLNPTTFDRIDLFVSPPPSPQSSEDQSALSKSRSRFSDAEDTIICEGVAKGLTWGQISRQLPHRKRATCFNRYRTLQGIRKSRKRSIGLSSPPLSCGLSYRGLSLEHQHDANKVEFFRNTSMKVMSMCRLPF